MSNISAGAVRPTPIRVRTFLELPEGSLFCLVSDMLGIDAVRIQKKCTLKSGQNTSYTISNTTYYVYTEPTTEVMYLK